ncbi:MAG: hypothetical protein ACYDHP_14710 [Ferrimicrobium sp.]
MHRVKQIHQLEEELAKFAVKLPSLPEGLRQFLATWAWLLAIIGGIASLLTAWSLWSLAHVFQGFCVAGFCSGGLGSLGPMFYLAFLLSLAYGIIYLTAAKPLKGMHKAGWDRLFLGTLVNVLAAVAFILDGSGGSLFSAILTIAIAWYLLFQIRASFLPKPGAISEPE